MCDGSTKFWSVLYIIWQTTELKFKYYDNITRITVNWIDNLFNTHHWVSLLFQKWGFECIFKFIGYLLFQF